MSEYITINKNHHRIHKIYNFGGFTYYLIRYSDMNVLVNSIINYLNFGDCLVLDDGDRVKFSGIIISARVYDFSDDCKYQQLLFLTESYKAHNFTKISRKQIRQLLCKEIVS